MRCHVGWLGFSHILNGERTVDGVARLDVETKQQILEAAVALLDRTGGARLRVREIAKAANVAIPTLYYHYADRESLLAEAQAARLLGIFSEIASGTSPTVDAIVVADQDEYVEVVAETREPYWNPANRDAVWRSVEAMVEVRRDPAVFERVCTVIEERMLQRADAVEQLQALGWVTDQVDAKQWVLFYFGAAFGQVFWDLCPNIDTKDGSNTAIDWIHRTIAAEGADVANRHPRDR